MSEYTLLAMTFCLPSQDNATQDTIILQDVIDIKQIMKHKWEVNNHEFHRIQLVAVYTKLKLLYWIIPKCVVAVNKGNLVHEWKSGIIMMAVLPADFHSLEDNSEILKGPLSSLKFLWQDDTEVCRYANYYNVCLISFLFSIKF